MNPICRYCERDIVLISAATSELARWNDAQCGAPPAPSQWKHQDGPAICVESWTDTAPGVRGTFAEPTAAYLRWMREQTVGTTSKVWPDDYPWG